MTDFRADMEATRSWKKIFEGVVMEWDFPKQLGDRLYGTCRKYRHILEVNHCFVLRVWGPGGCIFSLSLIVINPLSAVSLFQPHDRMLMDPDLIGETSGDTNPCNETTCGTSEDLANFLSNSSILTLRSSHLSLG